jgi:hypothetical protein
MREPLDPRIKKVAQSIGGIIGGTLPEGMGFALLIFDLEGGGDKRMNYISNAERATMITALKELIANFERDT